MTQSGRHAPSTDAPLILLTAGIRPHPPVEMPIFGIGPNLGISASNAPAAMTVSPLAGTIGSVVSVFAVFVVLLSFGLQEYVDALFGLIKPAVILGQLAALVIFFELVLAPHQAVTPSAGQA